MLFDANLGSAVDSSNQAYLTQLPKFFGRPAKAPPKNRKTEKFIISLWQWWRQYFGFSVFRSCLGRRNRKKNGPASESHAAVTRTSNFWIEACQPLPLVYDMPPYTKVHDSLSRTVPVFDLPFSLYLICHPGKAIDHDSSSILNWQEFTVLLVTRRKVIPMGLAKWKYQ